MIRFVVWKPPCEWGGVGNVEGGVEAVGLA